MDIKNALIVCEEKGLKVRNKNWKKDLYILSDIFGYFNLYENNKEINHYSPDIEDINAEWEVYNENLEQAKIIIEKASLLAGEIEKMCRTTVCSDCPLRTSGINNCTNIFKLKDIKL